MDGSVVHHTENGVKPVNTNNNTSPNVSVSVAIRISDAGRGAKVLPSQLLEIIVPSYSAWFSLSSIHDIERKGLPEFFNNRNKSKTADTYVEYRNFMVNTYRLNPGEYLTVTACRRNLTGDVCAIIRVHAFLEQWGLINYQPELDTRPGFGEKPSLIGPDFRSHFRVTAHAIKGHSASYGPITREKVQHLQQLQNGLQKSTEITLPTKTIEPSSSSTSIIPQKRAAADDDFGLEASTAVLPPRAPVMKRVKRSCNTCLAECTAYFYHSVKSPSLNLCIACYADARFPSSMISSEFVRISTVDAEARLAVAAAEGTGFLDDSIPWTEGEMYLLLEAVELFEEDWSKVADHVGTRNKEQCFTCFLQLPIMEGHLPGGLEGTVGDVVDLLADVDVDMKSRATTLPMRLRRLPISLDVDPGLGLGALLVALVRPEIARVAAKAAIQAVEDIRAAHWAVETIAIAHEVKEREIAKAHQQHSGKSALQNCESAPVQATKSSLSQNGAPFHSVAVATDNEDTDAELWQPAHLNPEEEKAARHLRSRYHHLEGQLFSQRLLQFLEVDTALENERAELESEKKQLMHDRVILGRDRVLQGIMAQAARPPPMQAAPVSVKGGSVQKSGLLKGTPGGLANGNGDGKGALYSVG
ncbi:hypothetical protein HDU67_000070 [Dinochytrium kinnereticum]|nr:hypothetical protein HDU67_000070 [Dinochytrium kinnereticum]